MTKAANSLEAYEMIDKITTIHPNPQGRNVPLEGFEKLYKASRGTKPISFEVGDALVGLKPSKIGILTGAFSSSMPHSENDGPIGAAVLGAALSKLGHKIIFPIEEAAVAGMKHLISYFGVEAEVYPIEIEKKNQNEEIASKIDVAVAIERTGANVAGILHGGLNAVDISGTRAKVDGVFERIHEKGGITIGIGDGGNEIGFGKIYRVAQEIFPAGKTCKCPCKQGNIAKTDTTFFLPATVSNWGAYAIAAGLAIRAEDPSLAHTSEGERKLLQICQEEDVRDGVVGKAVFSVDGIPGECSMAIAQILKTIVDAALKA